MITDVVELGHSWLHTFGEAEFDKFIGEIAEDFVLRVPFLPDGFPTEYRGREAARAILEGSSANRSRIAFKDVVIRRTEDPELIVITCRGEAAMNNGKPYCNDYVMFTRFRDGVAVEHVEYLNPLKVMAAAD